MLSPLDDYPVHQIAEVIRHVGTSDRNFYDRYYFNCYPTDGDLFLLVGLGQYPNLGTMDAFALARRGDDHIVVRASRALGADRMDLSVGPFKVDVLEGLRKLRVILEPTEHDLSFDLVFEGGIPATLEPRHFRRENERVTFDSKRFAQTGTWAGSLTVDNDVYDVTPQSWQGNRDRSWGIRPVGEDEPAGRRTPSNFFWIYSVMQFDDFSILVIVQEEEHGARLVEEAVRVWPSGKVEVLGSPTHELTFASESRDVTSAVLRLDDLTVQCELLLPAHLGVGTGYGRLEPDWRHGMWQGDLVVQGLRRKASEFDLPTRMFCPTDILTRFHLSDVDGQTHTGTGLFEVAVIGPHDQYGFTSFLDVTG
jgi:hypothetical protein